MHTHFRDEDNRRARIADIEVPHSYAANRPAAPSRVEDRCHQTRQPYGPGAAQSAGIDPDRCLAIHFFALYSETDHRCAEKASA